MRALICHALTGLDALSVETLPDPVPAADEVVVAVSHCGLNFFDTSVDPLIHRLRSSGKVLTSFQVGRFECS